MQFKLTEHEQASTLTLSGELTLLQAEQFKAELGRALEASRRVIIDTQALTGIDLACLQLLCSAHQSARAKGMELMLSRPQPEVFREQLAKTGLIGGHLCSRQSEVDCLWNGGDC